MQNQNQHLLQQITERDDYNIKVIFYLKLFFYLRWSGILFFPVDVCDILEFE